MRLILNLFLTAVLGLVSAASATPCQVPDVGFDFVCLFPNMTAYPRLS